MMDSGEGSTINMQALKMSLIAGVATGIGSLGLYMMLAKDQDQEDEMETNREEVDQQKIKDDKKKFEAQDAEELATIKKLLNDELKTHSNTPEFQTDAAGDIQYLFTRAFVLRITRLSQKYHTLIHHVMKKQAEDRRMQAIEENDDLEYSRAFYLQDIQKMRMATEIEDIIFDYFGIIETQYEASTNHFKPDVTFLAEKDKI